MVRGGNEVGRPGGWSGFRCRLRERLGKVIDCAVVIQMLRLCILEKNDLDMCLESLWKRNNDLKMRRETWGLIVNYKKRLSRAS